VKGAVNGARCVVAQDAARTVVQNEAGRFGAGSKSEAVIDRFTYMNSCAYPAWTVVPQAWGLQPIGGILALSDEGGGGLAASTRPFLCALRDFHV
jgi:hypothetical protein